MLILLTPTAQQQPESRRKRIVIQDGEAPTGALVWSDWRERNRVLIDWRRAVVRKFTKARSLRLAWVLRDLMLKEGYAFLLDDTLREELGTGSRKLRLALTDLQEGGAIVRAHVRISATEWQRRIFPGVAVLEVLKDAENRAPKRVKPAGGYRTNGGPNLRTHGGYNILKRDKTNTQRHAQIDAERREIRRRAKEWTP
jgi:hypothetical protein